MKTIVSVYTFIVTNKTSIAAAFSAIVGALLVLERLAQVFLNTVGDQKTAAKLKEFTDAASAVGVRLSDPATTTAITNASLAISTAVSAVKAVEAEIPLCHPSPKQG